MAVNVLYFNESSVFFHVLTVTYPWIIFIFWLYVSMNHPSSCFDHQLPNDCAAFGTLTYEPAAVAFGDIKHSNAQILVKRKYTRE